MATATDSHEPRPAARALGLAALYLALSIVWRVLVEGGVGVAVVARAIARGTPFDQLGDLPIHEMISPAVLAAASIVQLTGLGLIALGMAWWVERDVRASFGARSTRPGLIALGAAGGLTVGFFPGWIAQEVSARLPWLDMGNLALLNDMLAEGGVLARVLLLIGIALVAPIVEELVFRGFLWNLLDRALPRGVTWLATSALFAAYHVDPVHVIAVFFTGLFLGWLRLASGSVWPSIAAHFTNNALAAGVVLIATIDPEASSPWWLALASLAISVVLCGAAWSFRPKES